MIYIVTSGEYSDYGINAVCSSQAKAEAFIEESKKQTHPNLPYRIEEYEIDGRSKDTVATFWGAILDIATGDIERLDSRAEFVAEDERIAEVAFEDYVCEAYPKGHIVCRSYVSSEHAVELCLKKQQELQSKENNTC